MTPIRLGVARTVETLEVAKPIRRRSLPRLRTISLYFFVPLFVAVAFLSVAFAVRFPAVSLVIGFISAAVVGPMIEIWRDRHSRAQINFGE